MRDREDARVPTGLAALQPIKALIARATFSNSSSSALFETDVPASGLLEGIHLVCPTGSGTGSIRIQPGSSVQGAEYTPCLSIVQISCRVYVDGGLLLTLHSILSASLRNLILQSVQSLVWIAVHYLVPITTSGHAGRLAIRTKS